MRQRAILQKPEVLSREARRMLKDDRARGLAVEFGGNWLDIPPLRTAQRGGSRALSQLQQRSARGDVRGADPLHGRRRSATTGSMLDLLYGNYTFVNPVLAKHYGMPRGRRQARHTGFAWTTPNEYGRGGLLPMAVFLTQNAPGLRTSPVKRGYWVVRRVLGEVIPPPPPTVPELPAGRSEDRICRLRDMLAKHRDNPGLRLLPCALRFVRSGVRRLRPDRREAHEGSRRTPGRYAGGFPGRQPGLRDSRACRPTSASIARTDFVDNLSRKLLAYALGRSLMLSDEPTVERMQSVTRRQRLSLRVLWWRPSSPARSS